MSAKKMFEELGYKFKFHEDLNCIEFNNAKEDGEDYDTEGHIYFYLDKKSIHIDSINDYYYIGISEINAINKQIAELGWLKTKNKK